MAGSAQPSLEHAAKSWPILSAPPGCSAAVSLLLPEYLSKKKCELEQHLDTGSASIENSFLAANISSCYQRYLRDTSGAVKILYSYKSIISLWLFRSVLEVMIISCTQYRSQPSSSSAPQLVVRMLDGCTQLKINFLFAISGLIWPRYAAGTLLSSRNKADACLINLTIHPPILGEQRSTTATNSTLCSLCPKIDGLSNNLESEIIYTASSLQSPIFSC